MSSMRDVARLAGVSVSTVASVINGNKYVSEDLKRRIEAAIMQTGYRKPLPSDHDESQRTLAVILPGIFSTFFSPVLVSICDAASERNMSVMLMDSKRSIQTEITLLKNCIKHGIHNVILDSVCDVRHEEEYFSEIRREMIERRGMNIALIERRMADDAFFSVYVNNYNASYEATCHLLDQGCRHLVHITGANEFPHTRIREAAFRAALLEHGIRFDEKLLMQGDYTPLSGFAATRSILETGIPADGIFAANDQMAIGAIKALHAGGRKIPDDFAVVGFDNLPMASLVTPGLTTVQFPIYQLGYQAVNMLADTLDGRRPDNPRLKLDYRLIIRSSSVRGHNDDWELLGW